MAGVADPRPARRIVDPEAGKAKVVREAECRVCRIPLLAVWNGGSPLRSLTRAHLVPKGMGGGGGDDVDSNIIPLCGMGPGTCHFRMEANEEGFRQKIRARLRPDEVAYIIEKKGEGWLAKRFPE